MKSSQSTYLEHTTNTIRNSPLIKDSRERRSQATDNTQPQLPVRATIIATHSTSAATPFTPTHIQASISRSPAEYPLWYTPTPPALKKFCFDLEGVATDHFEIDTHESRVHNFAPACKPKGPFSNHSRKRPATRDPLDRDNSLKQMIAELSSNPPANSDGNHPVFKRRVGSSHNDHTSDAFHIATTTAAVIRKDHLLHPPRISNATQANRAPSVPLTPFPEAQVTDTTIEDVNVDELIIEDADVELTSDAPNLPSPRLSPTASLPTTLHLLTSQFSSIASDPNFSSTKQLETPLDFMSTSPPYPEMIVKQSTNTNIPAPPPDDVSDSNTAISSLAELPHIISTFDGLPPQLKSYLLLHLLRRCPYPTLQFIYSIILPTMKRDFLGLLPIELSYHILEYVDIKSIGRCGAVSRQWQHVVDGDGAEIAVWKRRLFLEGWYDEVEVQSEMAVVRSRIALSRSSNSAALPPPFKIPVSDLSPESGNDDEIAIPLKTISSRQNTFPHHLQPRIEAGAASSASCSSFDSINALSSPKSLAMDIIEERPRSIPQGVYKTLYARHHRLRRRWLRGQYRHTSFPGHGVNVVTCLQFDGDKIVSGSDDMSIHIYDTHTGACRKKLEGHEGGVWALQYWNNVLVSGSTDRTVRVWDMQRGVCTHLFEGHTSTVRCLMIVTPIKSDETGEVNPSVPLIVTGSRDATLRVWRLPIPGTDAEYSPSNASPSPAEGNNNSVPVNPYALHVLQGHTNSVRAIAGHGNVLVSGSYDCTVRMWDLTSGENIWVFRGHREKVYSVGYCHELKRAVSGSMDATVRIWCTRTGTAIHVLEGHTSLVGLLEVSSQYLVSAAADSSLRVWSPVSGQCLATLNGHAAAITCFHHDPKLNRIVSGSDGGVKVWELSSGVPRSASSRSAPPQYGRLLRDLVTNVQGVWRVRMDERRLVCAVQKEQGRTFFEVLDFAEAAEENETQFAQDRTINPVKAER